MAILGFSSLFRIKKSLLTILILLGIPKIKWRYCGIYSDNLDVN